MTVKADVTHSSRNQDLAMSPASSISPDYHFYPGRTPELSSLGRFSMDDLTCTPRRDPSKITRPLSDPWIEPRSAITSMDLYVPIFQLLLHPNIPISSQSEGTGVDRLFLPFVDVEFVRLPMSKGETESGEPLSYPRRWVTRDRISKGN